MNEPILNLKLCSITPIHVGASSDKKLVENIDYVINGGNIIILDEEKILKQFKIHEYSNSLAKGDLDNLLLTKGIENFSKRLIPISEKIGSEIMVNSKNLISLNPFIPGSSLKGAIRSVLFHYAKTSEHSEEQDVFGKEEKDGFRYLQIGDSHFEESTYINTKIFNLFNNGSDFEGGWKHAKKSTKSNFSNTGFTSTYECISTDQMADVRIVMNSAGYQKAISKNSAKMTTTLSEVLVDKKNLYAKIETYTDQYLQAEIDFFKKYSNQETDRIIQQLEIIRKKNSQAPVIRVGQGSGFHSITGNHQFPTDHSINGINNWGKGQLNGTDSAKSRKLAFERIDDEYVFYPMGFVQLIDPEVHQEYYASLQSQMQQKKDEIIALEAKAEEQRKAEQEKIRVEAEEAKKPKMTLLSQLNNRQAILIDAIVTGQEGNNVLAAPQVETMLETTISVRYPAGFPIGSTIQIKAKYSNGTLLVEGSPKLKK